MSQIVIQLKRAAAATLCYRNQLGVTVSHKPRVPTVNGQPLTGQKCMGSEETDLQRARRTHRLDLWREVVHVQFTATKSRTFYGSRAKEIWKAWCASVFGKTKKGKA